MQLKKILALPVILFLALSIPLAGCDSDDDEEVTTDAEKFLGSWFLIGVADDEGDQSADFEENFNSINFEFQNATTVTVTVDAVDDAGDQVLVASYIVTEGSKQITLTVGGVPLVLGYEFLNNDSSVNFSGNALVINAIFQTDLTGTVVLSATRASNLPS
jgi:hypothetical protein